MQEVLDSVSCSGQEHLGFGNLPKGTWAVLRKFPGEHCNKHHCKVKLFWLHCESPTFPKIILKNHIMIFSLCFYNRNNINTIKISLLHSWTSVS